MIINLLIIANILYLAGAYFYHKKDKSLTLHILFEYVLIATLVLVLVFGTSF